MSELESCHQKLEQMTIVDGLTEISSNVRISGAIPTPEDQQSHPFKHSNSKSEMAASFSTPPTNIAGLLSTEPHASPNGGTDLSLVAFGKLAVSTGPRTPESTPPPSPPSGQKFRPLSPSLHVVTDLPMPPLSDGWAAILSPPSRPPLDVEAWTIRFDNMKRRMDEIDEKCLSPRKKSR